MILFPFRFIRFSSSFHKRCAFNGGCPIISCLQYLSIGVRDLVSDHATKKLPVLNFEKKLHDEMSQAIWERCVKTFVYNAGDVRTRERFCHKEIVHFLKAIISNSITVKELNFSACTVVHKLFNCFNSHLSWRLLIAKPNANKTKCRWWRQQMSSNKKVNDQWLVRPWLILCSFSFHGALQEFMGSQG